MLVTLLGIVTLVNDSQPSKAREPMLVTVFPPSVDGMVNAPFGLGEILVTATELPLTS